MANDRARGIDVPLQNPAGKRAIQQSEAQNQHGAHVNNNNNETGARRLGERLADINWLDLPELPSTDSATSDDVVDVYWMQQAGEWQAELERSIFQDIAEELRTELCERIADTFDLRCEIVTDRDGTDFVVRGKQDGRDTVLALTGGKWFVRTAKQLGLPRIHESKRLGRSLTELRDNPTEVDWLLTDQLERQTNALFVGARGTLKSFLALDWALRVAVFKRLPVLVISAEGRDADRRALAWMKAHAPDVALENVPFRIIERRLDLTAAENLLAVRRECADIRDEYGQNVGLIVLDTFSKLSGSLEENDNSAVKVFIGSIDTLARELGAATIIVAHQGHTAAGRARGASALGADTDAEHVITRDAVSGTISVTRERFKSSPELPPLIYRWRVVDLGRRDRNDRPVTSLVLDRLEGSAALDAAVIKSRRVPRADSPQGIVLAAMKASTEPCVLDGDLFVEVEQDLGDRAKRKFERAVKALINARWLYRHGDRLSLHAVLPAESTDEA